MTRVMLTSLRLICSKSFHIRLRVTLSVHLEMPLLGQFKVLYVILEAIWRTELIAIKPNIQNSQRIEKLFPTNQLVMATEIPLILLRSLDKLNGQKII